MNTNTLEQLSKLRMLITQRNWTERRKVVEELFSQLDTGIVKLIALEWIKRFLPKFQGKYEDITWASDYISEVDQRLRFATEKFDWSIERYRQQNHPEDNYESPGMSNYVEAILDLTRMMQAKTNPKAIEWAVNAITNVFIAYLDYQWGNEHPELWRQIREASSGVIASTYFWPDAMVAELDIQQWIQLAQEIENQFSN